MKAGIVSPAREGGQPLIAFDLDGTVANTAPQYERLAVAVMYPLKDYAARQLYLATMGRPFLHQLRMIFTDHEVIEKMFARFLEGTREIYRDARPFEEALGCVRTLRGNGARTALVSSTLATEVESWTRRRGIDDLFDHVGGWTEREATTKDVQLRRLGAAVFVGDAPLDETYARRAGARFYRVADGSHLGSVPEEEMRAWMTT